MKQGMFSLWKGMFALMVCISLATSNVLAVPAYPGWLKMEQPDGSTIEIRHVGDEFYHYSINREGKRVKQNAEGWWVEAGEVPSAEVAKARHAAAKARKSARRAPQEVGTEPNLAPKGVVILVNFKDDAMQSSHTQAVFDELCNSTNCTVNKYSSKNYGSAAQYFADQSNGSYRPQFDVYGPVTLSRNVAYYGTDKDTGDPDEDEGDDQHATDAVVEACILANQQYSGLNFANYDSDKDGYVDFVYVIYAGKGQADGGAATTIWPHNWEVESAISYGYCTYTKTQCQIDGKKLNNYAMSGELSGSSLGGIGTLCHEFGHVMGLPDLYDTKYGTNYENGVTPGNWNIMDGGSYNGDGHCPPNYDPWQKYFFGWVTPVNLATEGKNITLLPNGTEGYQSYQINSANKLQTATTAGVNYYIENRQKQGWDAFIPTSGMLVWKINFNASAWTNNEPNNTAGSPKYTIVPADGKTKNYGATGDTYPYGSSVRSYTPISGHALTEITKSGSNITFKYNGGQQKTECSYELLGEHCTYPADGVVAYNAALSLTITPEAGYTLADPSCWTVEMGTNNELVYGEGFTYNAGTNEFRIEKVTDDVAIMAEGKAQVTLTWMANGVQFAQTVTAGSVVLPENEPEGCDGKVFVGWTKTANYESASVAPAFVQTGDAASQTTFYAVFATQGEGGGSEVNTYTFTSKSWAESTGTWTGTKDGNQYTANQGVQVTTGATGAGASTSKSFSGVTKAVVNYCTNSKNGEGSIDVTIGSTKVSHDVTKTGGTSLRDLEFEFEGVTGSASIVVNCTTNSIYVNSISITTGGGASYSDYTTSCTPPCVGELTGITLNTTNVKKAFTEGETFNYTGLVVTANFDGCDSKTVVPTSVSTPDMSTIGQQTVTVTYEGKTATYEITIAALPTYTIRFYNNGALVGTAQNVKQGQQPNVPATPSACEGYTFGGWMSTVLADDVTEKPSFVTNFTATQNQDYYAAYSYVEEGEGGSTSVEDQLTRATTGITGANYGNWSGKSVSSDAVYAGNSAGGNDAIQLRSKNSNSGIVTTTSGGMVTKVTVSWNSNTASGRTLNVYGKNSAYSDATDLYGDASDELLGTIVCGTSTELVIDGDYSYVGVCSNSGAMYLDAITFTWSAGGTGSTTYYTTSPSCEPCTSAVTVNKGTTSHGTFSLDYFGELSTCGGAVTVTVTATPAEGYQFKEITQTGVAGAVIDQAAKTVTYAKKSEGVSTINVVFEEKEKYTVRFINNGETLSTQELYEGESAEKPESMTAPCDKYSFAGWWTAELAEDNREAKSWVNDFTVSQDQDYYAVYSYSQEVEGGGESEVASVTFKTAALDKTQASTDIREDIVESEYGISSYEGEKIFAGKGGAKLGTSSVTGSLTLTLASTAKVTAVKINASQYGSDTGELKVTAGETSLGSQAPDSDITFEAENAVETNTITIETTTKRAYIASISVLAEGNGKSIVTFYTTTTDCQGTGTSTEIVGSEPTAKKAIRNGQIVIVRGEAVYTLTGTRVN